MQPAALVFLIACFALIFLSLAMGIKSLQVILRDTVEGGPGVFFSGSTITGVVRISVEGESQAVKGVRVQCVGQAKVSWTEPRHKQTLVYKNKEQYLDYSDTLLATDELSAGDHEFPFSVPLEANIPSSFEGKHGHVRYKVTATIDDPHKKTEHFFTVLTTNDLNKNEDAQLPVNEKKDKTPTTLFGKSDPISATITIPRAGFVPGEKIPINAEILNQSKVKIKDTTLRIIQKVSFNSKTLFENKTRTRTSVIAEVKRDEEIEEGGRLEWKDFTIKLPPMPTSPLEHCSIISINTFVELEVNPAGLHRDLVVHAPIIVGSIPLRSTFQDFIGEKREDLDTPLQMYPELAPPSYNECKPRGGGDSSSDEEEKNRRKAEKDSDEEGDESGARQSYAPKYMTYNTSDD